MTRARTISLVAALLLFSTFGVPARAASIAGTVTNKTTNRPSAGDSVVLVDVQAGMTEAAQATTNGSGQYSLAAPGIGPYLIRVTHQGGSYFIAAPQSGSPGNVNVYDVAPKVDGVAIDADMFLLEAAGGMLRVHERFLVRNVSLPPRAQFSDKTFEVVIPAGAEIDGASATRPGGLPTNTHLVPLSEKGHYTFNVPIQPDKDEKETLFEVQYHVSYSGKYAFSPQLQMPADNLVVYAAKGIEFKPAPGSSFQSRQEDPRVQTFVAKNLHPGQTIGFSISGEGTMPHDAQSNGMPPQTGMGEVADTGVNQPSNVPGGGIGSPIGSPDPLTKYKWWIVTILALGLVTASGFLLRKRAEVTAGGISMTAAPAVEPISAVPHLSPARPVAYSTVPFAAPANTTDALLNLLKEEMFAVEREKLSGALPPEEYAAVKSGLEALLRRVLKTQSPAGRTPSE